ncbi:ATP-dependent nuclease [Roseovarius sp. C03]|uniref:ATP-dependent nuclease n=1 Tax=Roseovarius sp. C03 TaxID=3449222 RepID=UPI003EDBEDEC
MDFTVIPHSQRSKRFSGLKGENEVFLVRDNWDDYGFKTSFHLVYFDGEGERYDAGLVKILQSGQRSGYTSMPDTFTALSSDYASLGQDQNYYETLLELPDAVRLAILVGMRDVVWDDAIRTQHENEEAYETSLTRSVGETRIEKHIAILHGQAEPTSFHFTYRFPGSDQCIEFKVDPKSQPPTNIHVVIGRNGVGKTTFLTSLSTLLRRGRDRRLGRITFGEDADGSAKDQFAGLITVAFSAFDHFAPPSQTSSGPLRSRKAGTQSGISYTYVGLKKRVLRKGSRTVANKSDAELQRDFVESTLQCLRSASRPRWQAAMRILEADQLFANLGLSALPEVDADELEEQTAALFEKASSGHKIVLLTLTRLAELVDEKTLVLIDEPEAHLHPPLVMAFVRALSDLLARRNGVAILATHSPVVVQEVPARCVTLMFRTGEINVERPEIETFAENLGVLTREIFRVEVTESGHHALIAKAVDESETLDEVLELFGDQLGAEGRALARAILRNKG